MLGLLLAIVVVLLLIVVLKSRRETTAPVSDEVLEKPKADILEHFFSTPCVGGERFDPEQSDVGKPAEAPYAGAIDFINSPTNKDGETSRLVYDQHADAGVEYNYEHTEAGPYWQDRKAPAPPGNVCVPKLDPNILGWSDTIGGDERVANGIRARGDGTRATTGILNRRRFLDKHLRHEVEDAERGPWWGRNE